MATEQTAQTARAEAGAVAEKVKEETKTVAQQAQQQASSAVHQVQQDVRQRANEEATKFAQTLHETSRQLQQMSGAADDQGVAATLVREGSNATERLASRLDQGGLDAVMADIRSWARRQPGTFLLGAAAAGFVAGRLVRNLSGDGTSSNAGNGYRAMPTTPELSDRLDPELGIGGAG
jgi:hypothetical protein